jgi:hypothetical protein
MKASQKKYAITQLLRSGDGEALYDSGLEYIFGRRHRLALSPFSARCDGWQRRRAITQFALALQGAKLFLADLSKVTEPINRRQQ